MEERGFFSREELLAAGFSHVGKETRISRKISLYGVSGSIGNYTRIDDFCILKGRLEIGVCVHIAGYVLLGGGADNPITCRDCSAISSHTTVFTGTADYRANAISNPTVPLDMQASIFGPVTLGEGVVIGAQCVLLPFVEVGDGTSVGANLVIHKSLPEGKIIVSRNGKPEIVGERDANVIRALAARARTL